MRRIGRYILNGLRVLSMVLCVTTVGFGCAAIRGPGKTARADKAPGTFGTSEFTVGTEPTNDPISDDEVVAFLTEAGTLDKYVLLDGPTPAVLNDHGELSVVVIYGDRLEAACVRYLRVRGTPVLDAGGRFRPQDSDETGR